MQTIINQTVFIFLGALFIWLLYLLSPMLTPFLLGALLVYLTNPLVKWLDKWHIPNIISVILVFLFLLSLFILLILMLFPIFQQQLIALMDVIPDIINWLQATIIPRFKTLINLDTIKSTLSSALPKTGALVSTILDSSRTVIEWFIDLVLTSVVTFYLLRDWDRVLAGVHSLLPHRIKPTALLLAKECDTVLSAFFRGQLLVMLALGFIYGIGLTLIGLKVGLMIGLIGGLLSIVPYLGSIFVVIMGALTALIEYGTWQSIAWVALVYVVGQTIEGYVLTPYLVGERIGLHPVAVIFAIMAFGTLFGFFGVLVALPVAAVIMVLLRFLRTQYQ